MKNNGSRAVKKSAGIDMTAGNVLVQILLFTLPLMATNLLQAFYNAADLMVVSLSNEPDAVGAVGTTGTIISFVVNVFIGCSVGTKVIVARALGEGDDVKVNKSVHTSVIASLMFGVFGGAMGALFSRPVLVAMGNTGKLLELATTYTLIYMAGVPFISATNFMIAVLHADGNSKVPFIVLAFSGLLNVVLNLFFVLVCGMSVEGVSLATAISNLASAIALFVILVKQKSKCRVRIKDLKFDGRTFGNIVKVGLPAALQSAVFCISNMLIQSSLLKVNNSLVGSDAEFQPVVKGNSAGSSLETFLYTSINSVGQAAISFVGQNAGAKRYDRVKRVMISCYAVSFFVAVIFAAIVILLKDPLLSLYGVKKAEDGLMKIAYEAALSRIYIMFTPYFLIGFMEVGAGIMQGFGRTITASLSSLFGACVVRIIWIYTLFAAFPTLDMLLWSYPVSWALTAGIHFVFSLTTLRGLCKKEKTLQAAA